MEWATIIIVVALVNNLPFSVLGVYFYEARDDRFPWKQRSPKIMLFIVLLSNLCIIKWFLAFLLKFDEEAYNGLGAWAPYFAYYVSVVCTPLLCSMYALKSFCLVIRQKVQDSLAEYKEKVLFKKAHLWREDWWVRNKNFELTRFRVLLGLLAFFYHVLFAACFIIQDTDVLQLYSTVVDVLFAFFNVPVMILVTVNMRSCDGDQLGVKLEFTLLSMLMLLLLVGAILSQVLPTASFVVYIAALDLLLLVNIYFPFKLYRDQQKIHAHFYTATGDGKTIFRLLGRYRKKPMAQWTVPNTLVRHMKIQDPAKVCPYLLVGLYIKRILATHVDPKSPELLRLPVAEVRTLRQKRASFEGALARHLNNYKGTEHACVCFRDMITGEADRIVQQLAKHAAVFVNSRNLAYRWMEDDGFPFLDMSCNEKESKKEEEEMQMALTGKVVSNQKPSADEPSNRKANEKTTSSNPTDPARAKQRAVQRGSQSALVFRFEGNADDHVVALNSNSYSDDENPQKRQVGNWAPLA